MEYFRLKNWEEYQHYKDRSPPWIKLHNDLLSSETWVMLDDASRCLAVACMLLASRTDNKIPADKAYLRRVGYLNSDPDLEKLIAINFIELLPPASGLQADASTMQADARPEERRGEKRREEREAEAAGQARPAKQKKQSAKGTRLSITKLPEDWLIFCQAEKPGLDPQQQFDIFADYWAAQPGQKGVKSDWLATWRNWVRRATEDRSRLSVVGSKEF